MNGNPTILPLSVFAWTGGALAGAAIAKKHRLAGGALGAILTGTITDALIERQRRGVPGGALGGVAIIGTGLVALVSLTR